MKKLLFAFLLGLLSMPASAQSKTEMIQRMNEIKSETGVYYWYAFAYNDEESARQYAIRYLVEKINQERGSDDFTEDMLEPYIKQMAIPRGSTIQCFAYIRQSDAERILRGEEPAPEDTAPAVSEEENSVAETVVQLPEHLENAQSYQEPAAERPFVPDAFVQRLVQIDNFVSVYKTLKMMKSQGQILQFGKLKDVEDYSSFDIILFDIQTQKIVSVLSAVTGSGMRINMMNGMEDALENYPAKLTAAIWYIKK